MDKLLELFGLGTPFLYGVGTYAFFHWLDSNASDEAKAAFARLLDAKHYDNTAISAAILEFFDRVYTYPLFSWRAFRRSVSITTIVSAIYFYETGPYQESFDFIFVLQDEVSKLKGSLLLQWAAFIGAWMGYAFVLGSILFINILSDFISLFLIRRWFLIAGNRPIAALLVSTLSVLVVIVVSGVLRDIFFGIDSDSGVAKDTYAMLRTPFTLIIPALVVLIWMPLLGVSLVIVRSINVFSPLVQNAQWFLREGKEHPLNAVGLVGGIIVFFGTVLWRHLRGESLAAHAFDYGAGLVLALL
jgi:hypothetical protein